MRGVQRRDLLFISLGWILFTVAVWVSSDTIFTYLQIYPGTNTECDDSSHSNHFDHYSNHPHKYWKHNSTSQYSHHRNHKYHHNPANSDSNSPSEPDYQPEKGGPVYAPGKPDRFGNYHHRGPKNHNNHENKHHNDKDKAQEYDNGSSSRPSHHRHHNKEHNEGKHSKCNHFDRYSHHPNSGRHGHHYHRPEFDGERGINVVTIAKTAEQGQFELSLQLHEYLFLKGNTKVSIYSAQAETIKAGMNSVVAVNCTPSSDVSIASCDEPARVINATLVPWAEIELPFPITAQTGDYKLLYVINTPRRTIYNGYDLQILSNGSFSLQEDDSFIQEDLPLKEVSLY